MGPSFETDELNQFQGFLSAPDGTPANGEHDILVAIYDGSTDGYLVWSQSQTTTVVEGFIHILVGGDANPLDQSIFTGVPLWLGITIDSGAELSPRTPISSVPYSVSSANSKRVAWEDVANVPQSVADGGNYTAGDGVLIEDNQISIDPTKYAAVNHNHDNRYWTKEEMKTAGSIPLGSIIDWWRPNGDFTIPSNFMICDGSTVSDPESPYYNITIPNLADRFIRGVTDPANIGDSGGIDSHAHTYSVDHDHASQNTTDAGEHNHMWSYFTANENWRTYDSNGVNFEMINWTDGIDKSAGAGLYPIGLNSTGSTRYYYTDDENNHSHSLDLPNHDEADRTSSSINHLPPYVGMLKIIRIK